MTVINPSPSSVSSVFGRSGAVVATTGDYTAAQVTNAIDGSQTAVQTMAGQLKWAAQSTALVLGAQTATNPVVQNKLLAADANPAFEIDGNGKLQWGAGGSSAFDCSIARTGGSTLSYAGEHLFIASGSGSGLQIKDPNNNVLLDAAFAVAHAITMGYSAGGTSKISFYGATPIVQAQLSTGAGHTVDDVIAALQNLGLVHQ